MPWSDVQILDEQGQERDTAWLHQNFGDVLLHEGGRPGWAVVKAQAQSGPASVVVRCLHASGEPREGAAVGWYWPDAPASDCYPGANGWPDGMLEGRAVHGPTNVNGDVGFGMGGGAWYNVPGERGPHAAWVCGDSDVVWGLGMTVGPEGPTDHRHLNLTIQWTEGEPELPPDDIIERLDRIEGTVNAIATQVDDLRLALSAGLRCLASELEDDL